MPCCIKSGQQHLAAGRENFIFFLCPLDGEQFSDGALPFALHPPILCVSGQSLRTSVHGRYARTQEKGKVLAYRDFLSTDGMVYSV